jgi:hypothetical protein
LPGAGGQPGVAPVEPDRASTGALRRRGRGAQHAGQVAAANAVPDHDAVGPGHTVEAKQLLATAARHAADIRANLDWDTRRVHPTLAAHLLAAPFNNINRYELGTPWRFATRRSSPMLVSPVPVLPSRCSQSAPNSGRCVRLSAPQELQFEGR